MTDQTKIALITGASRGLGAALAEALAPEYHIVAVARTTGGLEELDDRIKAKGGSATLAPMDITDPNAMATLCRGIHDRWGKVDLWLHTAIHTSALTPTHFIDPKEWAKAVNTNANATSVLIPYVTPLLGENGHAVFFDDPKAGEKFYGIYGATKAAQMALARSWAAETERTGPRVSIVEPAPMPTAVRARFHPGEDRDALNSTASEAARILALL
ncbi:MULTISPECIES: SDR family oxidoreductase [unclassified Ruegeria]|uniref:SDR family NAD(P)-dependent oxidoreductase n=1 Tax=unclassified Ruegeria TaxID=2625375 RepID=UPI00148964E7|nr:MULTISPECIES: SDR family NAD(P)-dependent oxidoreductase [unclassified Ruegeria]NOD78010.1 SDR family NAD(P)-dependent oxidoreductase [Ruegeria sp. HKCCD4332]NOD87594.1 SDR family NAD(P)-dependent oxidoreductase [Ruegeria sp. HKCCD4318]NOE15627.1 SDR family NAD(P)-dependent oxidoreductase [Ruegeria sp. HKCCD4318-2]NOG08682.1 SDR family NAD(P)-dependent oxidoreductase [Ruegeria sp. HKCCD4315]